MAKAATKKDIDRIEKQNKELQDTLKDVGDIGEDELDISDQNVDALKYALHTIIHNKGSKAGTSNLTQKKIKALSRMKALNFFYRSRAIQEYYDNILELQRSEAKEPTNILGMIGDLFKFQPGNQNTGVGTKIRQMVRR